MSNCSIELLRSSCKPRFR